MKKISLLLIILFIASSVFSQDSIMPILNQKFPAYELHSDLAFIKNKAVYKKYNHDGLLFVGKERFTQLYDSIKNVINEKDEMSRLEFYFLTAPLVNSLQDERSYYSLLGNYAYDAQKKEYLTFAERSTIPFGMYTFHDSVFITTDSLDLYKARIISLNDIPANKVVSEIFKYISFRDYSFYQKNKYGPIGSYYYPILSNILFGFQNEIEISYTPFGIDSVLKTKIQLLQSNDSLFFKKIKKHEITRSWYSLKVQNDYSILRISALPNSRANIHILNEIFLKIKKLQPKALIIDISSCSWSSDIFWITFLNYLYEGELSLYEFQEKPVSLKKFTKKKLNYKYITGQYYDIYKSCKYYGPLYLIVGPRTASSAVRFADILKYNKIVDKIFGSETLSRTTQYDYSTKHYLPITGLRLSLSTNLRYALDKNTNTHGLIPDVEVKPNNVEEFWKNYKNKFVIEKVINLIESENQENENTSD